MSDFCYSRPMLKRVMQQAELMDRMMERLGVNPAAAARLEKGTVLYEARTRCIVCRRERECKDWLKCAPLAPPMEAPEFCQNSAFFRRCAVRTRA